MAAQTTKFDEGTTLKPPFSQKSDSLVSPAVPLATSHASTSYSTNDTQLSAPLTPYDSLPTLAGYGRSRFLANDDVASFLKQDLDFSRLNAIHRWLWIAGRMMAARPLHRYRLLDYQIMCIDQMDLHLCTQLSSPSQLLVKPLPAWILSYDFWAKHLCNPGDQELHASACGFLVSYVWLITTPLDLKMAHDLSLLPSFVTWHWWKAFVKDIVGNVDIDTLHQVNIRYHFGVLRLDRINSIYRWRFFTTNFVNGYWYAPPRYVPFFERNFSWVLIPFVFLSLILSAMQVGIALYPLENNHVFLHASYGTVMFAVIGGLGLFSSVLVSYILLFVYQMVSTIRMVQIDQNRRRRMMKETKEESKKV